MCGAGGEIMNEDEFDDLLRRILDGDRSEKTLRRLGEEMKGDPGRIGRYLELMEMDELLSCRLNLPGARFGDGDRVVDFPGNGKRKMITRFAGAALLAAACVALLIAISGFLDRSREGAASKDIVAVLIDSEDCVWEYDEKETLYSFGSPFGKEEILRVKSGIARLAINGNAGLALEGPAQIELVSDQEVRIFYGRVSAYAPEEAIGFKLTTPDVEIVDLGTRFAAEVDEDGHTDVHVFEGEISVKGEGAEVNEMITEGRARRYGSGIVQGRDIENDPSLFADPPALEQLLAIAVSNDWKKTGRGRKQKNPDPSKVKGGGDIIACQDFTNGSGSLDGSLEGLGFGNNPWKANQAYTRKIPTVASHSGLEKAGGYLLVRGRNNAGPSILNRLRRKLDDTLPNDFYFAIRAQYRGLDENDFFSLWIDVHGREDGSHSYVPTLGIREGRYFARLHREHAAVAGHPADDGEFVIAGHYVWDESLNKARIALWLNPVANGNVVPAPDASSLGPERKDGAPELRFIGLYMGQYTEVSDELLVYGLSVAKTFSGAVEAAAGNDK